MLLGVRTGCYIGKALQQVTAISRHFWYQFMLWVWWIFISDWGSGMQDISSFIFAPVKVISPMEQAVELLHKLNTIYNPVLGR